MGRDQHTGKASRVLLRTSASTPEVMEASDKCQERREVLRLGC